MRFLLSSVCFRGAEVVVLLMPRLYIKHHSNKLICLRESTVWAFPQAHGSYSPGIQKQGSSFDSRCEGTLNLGSYSKKFEFLFRLVSCPQLLISSSSSINHPAALFENVIFSVPLPYWSYRALHFPTELIFNQPHHPHLYWINTTLSPRHHQCLYQPYGEDLSRLPWALYLGNFNLPMKKEDYCKTSSVNPKVIKVLLDVTVLRQVHHWIVWRSSRVVCKEWYPHHPDFNTPGTCDIEFALRRQHILKCRQLSKAIWLLLYSPPQIQRLRNYHQNHFFVTFLLIPLILPI